MYTGSKENIVIPVVVVVVIGLLVWVLGYNGEKVMSGKSYSNDTYGIAFNYPDNYVQTEKYVADPSTPHNAIVLYDSANLPAPTNGEGPTAIVFDFYSNSLSKTPLEKWVRNSPASNFNLGNKFLIQTRVAETPAVTYNWDGLYSGKSIVFEHKGFIVHASVTYMSETDKIKTDFDNLIANLTLK
jgi:hypothetical protein